MFALDPNDEKGGNSSSSSSGQSQLKTNLKFFGKLGLYFIGIRIAHVYLGTTTAADNNNKSE